MKKVILTAIAVLGFAFANAQDGKFKVGVNAGLPIGDISDFYSMNLGVDAAYLWNVIDKLDVGVTTGYSAYLGKEHTFGYGAYEMKYKTKTASYIPVAATAQYSLTDMWFVGADLGYAISVSNGSAGFLYEPKFGYQNEKIELYAGYKAISNTGSAASLNIGVNYKF